MGSVPEAPSRLTSVYDAAVQSVIKQAAGNFNPSPQAWEDQLLYFLLPDRFSDDKESQFFTNTGSWQKAGTTPPFKAGIEDAALATAESTKAWQDAGGAFCGGTLKGIESKLGYLLRMGVTAVWIGPVFKQVAALETYHGYGVQNFLDVDPRFGTKEDLRDLVKKAHEMEMYVIQDIICNHSGDVFEYSGDAHPDYQGGRKYSTQGFYDSDHKKTIPFQKVDLEQNPSAYPNAAIWPAELQDGDAIFTCEGKINDWDAYPEYVEGDFFTLKDLDLGGDDNDDPDSYIPTKALTTLIECYKYWIAFADLDAFRLDTVKHMGKAATRFFATAIHEYAMSIGKQRFMIVGEITGGDTYETVYATGLDAALDVGGLQEALWKLPKGLYNPKSYFDTFRNADFLEHGSRTWLRNKIVTMIDDHDQVWKGDDKGRFCSDGAGPQLMFAAIAFNLTTLGIPCIYYGSEQCFDGSGGSGLPGHGSDQWIRECMFGGAFGAFRSVNAHFFNEEAEVWNKVHDVAKIRRHEMALTRGRQYLREISETGREGTWGYPSLSAGGGNDRIDSIIAWSRIFNNEEILCVLNTDRQKERTTFVTIDGGLHADNDALDNLYQSTPLQDQNIASFVMTKGGRRTTQVVMGPAAFAMFKKAMS